MAKQAALRLYQANSCWQLTGMLLWGKIGKWANCEGCNDASNSPSKMRRLHAIITALVPHIRGTLGQQVATLVTAVVDRATTDSEGDAPPCHGRHSAWQRPRC